MKLLDFLVLAHLMPELLTVVLPENDAPDELILLELGAVCILATVRSNCLSAPDARGAISGKVQSSLLAYRLLLHKYKDRRGHQVETSYSDLFDSKLSRASCVINVPK